MIPDIFTKGIPGENKREIEVLRRKMKPSWKRKKLRVKKEVKCHTGKNPRRLIMYIYMSFGFGGLTGREIS